MKFSLKSKSKSKKKGSGLGEEEKETDKALDDALAALESKTFTFDTAAADDDDDAVQNLGANSVSPSPSSSPSSPVRKSLGSLHADASSPEPATQLLDDDNLSPPSSPEESYLPKTLSMDSFDDANSSNEFREDDRSSARKERRRMLPDSTDDPEDEKATSRATKSSEPNDRCPGSIITVTAPPGKLGLVIDSHPTSGVPVIFSVLSDSTVAGLVRTGDRLTLINTADVTSLGPSEIAKALHEIRGATRRLRLFRPDSVEEEIVEFNASFRRTHVGYDTTTLLKLYQ